MDIPPLRGYPVDLEHVRTRETAARRRRKQSLARRSHGQRRLLALFRRSARAAQ
jgi:hypothetical protein